MGFEGAAIEFLLCAREAGLSFNRVLTIGRQGLHVDQAELAAMLRSHGLDPSQAASLLSRDRGFAEPLLEYCGAGSVDSLDVSAYEGATIVHDMNLPLPDRLRERYTLVVDGGSLEHVFHYTVALRNCMEAVASGGHFATITPANNLMGHGFYQLSPELFFRALSPENGFEMVRLALFETPWNGSWFEVADPQQVHSRVELSGGRPAYLLVCARRVSVRPVFEGTPQQSDYSALWNETHGRMLSVAETRPAPLVRWKRLIPGPGLDLYRRLRPFHPRLFRRRTGDFFR